MISFMKPHFGDKLFTRHVLPPSYFCVSFITLSFFYVEEIKLLVIINFKSFLAAIYEGRSQSNKGVGWKMKKKNPKVIKRFFSFYPKVKSLTHTHTASVKVIFISKLIVG